MGCRLKLMGDCDVTACIATCFPESGIDLYVGIGGSPEGIIAAAAMKCLGGLFQGQLVDKEGKPIKDDVYNMEDLAKGDVVFSATGITDGLLLDRVKHYPDGPVTHSLILEPGKIKHIVTRHI